MHRYVVQYVRKYCYAAQLWIFFLLKEFVFYEIIIIRHEPISLHRRTRKPIGNIQIQNIFI